LLKIADNPRKKVFFLKKAEKKSLKIKLKNKIIFTINRNKIPTKLLIIKYLNKK